MHSTTTQLVAQLGPHHRQRVLTHLRQLRPHDLWLRFGYSMTSEAVERYVRGLHFTRDAVFGILDDDARLLALGHLAFEPTVASTTAEFGISVLPAQRRQGLGSRLLRRAALHARNRGATRLMMTYVPENDALRLLAQRAGMNLEPDPHDPRAYLSLETPTADSLMDETFTEALAAIDLGFRVANAESATHGFTSA